MRYGRLVVNLVITGACAGLIALEIAGPSTPATARRPIDTFTHVDVKVDDHGVHAPAQNISAGQVEITLTDARTNKSGDLTVKSDPQTLSLQPGTQLTTVRDLTIYHLRAYAGTHAMPGTADLSIVMPALEAPTEPAHRVTVNLDTTGVNLPDRDARFDAPIAAGSGDAPNADVPWTAVATGPANVVIRNRRPDTLTCAVDGRAGVSVPGGATRTLSATIAAGQNSVDCGATKIDLVAL